MNKFATLIVLTLLVLILGAKPGHAYYHGGSEVWVTEPGDTFSGICSRYQMDGLLPHGRRVHQGCMERAATYYFQTDWKTAKKLAPTLGVGVPLFIPSVSHAALARTNVKLGKEAGKLEGELKSALDANGNLKTTIAADAGTIGRQKKEIEGLAEQVKQAQAVAWIAEAAVIGILVIGILAVVGLLSYGWLRARHEYARLREEIGRWRPGSPWSYSFNDPDFGRLTAKGTVVGTGLKPDPDGKGFVPYQLIKTEFQKDFEHPIESVPESNIRRHIKKHHPVVAFPGSAAPASAVS